jgi:hypothetical protein
VPANITQIQLIFRASRQKYLFSLTPRVMGLIIISLIHRLIFKNNLKGFISHNNLLF